MFSLQPSPKYIKHTAGHEVLQRSQGERLDHPEIKHILLVALPLSAKSLPSDLSINMRSERVGGQAGEETTLSN